MKREVSTDSAPAAVGPYSQAIISDGLVFCSGQIPLDPATGEMVDGGIGVQTRRCLDSISAVLEAAGSSLRGVVKTTVYLADVGDFVKMNDVYAEYFEKPAPARAAVEVSALPKGARIEIDAIARTG